MTNELFTAFEGIFNGYFEHNKANITDKLYERWNNYGSSVTYSIIFWIPSYLNQIPKDQPYDEYLTIIKNKFDEIMPDFMKESCHIALKDVIYKRTDIYKNREYDYLNFKIKITMDKIKEF